jgi:putative SOS response-associated peptidase YedK
MWGRYANLLPAEALAAIFGVAAPLPNFPRSWNVAPTQQRPLIRRHMDTGDRRLDLLAWGWRRTSPRT